MQNTEQFIPSSQILSELGMITTKYLVNAIAGCIVAEAFAYCKTFC